MRQLEVEECINWILHEIAFENGFAYRYLFAQNWDFLVFTARDYFLNAKKLRKLERLTGMVLLQIESNNGISEIWFGRLAGPYLNRHKSIIHRVFDGTSNTTEKTDHPRESY